MFCNVSRITILLMYYVIDRCLVNLNIKQILSCKLMALHKNLYFINHQTARLPIQHTTYSKTVNFYHATDISAVNP